MSDAPDVSRPPEVPRVPDVPEVPRRRQSALRLALEAALVLAISLVAVAAQLRWVTQYREGPSGDYAMHLANAAGFASIMDASGHLTEKLVAAWAWPDLYASGTYAVSYLLRPFTGASELGLLESLNFFLPIAVLGAYMLGRAVACPVSDVPRGSVASGMAIGATASVLLIADPRFILTCRRYWVDMPQTAMILITLAALVYSDGLRRRGWSIAFGVALGLSLLVKYTAVWFVGVPLVVSVVWGLWRERPRVSTVLEFLAAGGVAAACLLLLSNVSLRHGMYMTEAGELTPPLTFQLIFGCTATCLLWATFAWYRLRGVMAHATYAIALAGLIAGPWAIVNRFVIAERWRATALQMPEFQEQLRLSLHTFGFSLSWWILPCIALGAAAAVVFPSRRPSMGLVLLASLTGVTLTFLVLGYADRYLAPVTSLTAVLAAAWIPAVAWIAWPIFALSLVAPYMMLFGYPPSVDIPFEQIVSRHFAGTVANQRAEAPRDTEPVARAIHGGLQGARSVCILAPAEPETRDEMMALFYVLTAVENWSAAPARVEFGVYAGNDVSRQDLLALQPLRLRTLATWRGDPDADKLPAFGLSSEPPQAVVLPAPQADPEAATQRAFGGSWRRVPLDDTSIYLMLATSTR